MKIGRYELKHGLILGPMAGYSDRAMRKICLECGAEYAVTEMVSAKALCFHDKKTPLLAAVAPDEMPVAVQIFGKEPSVLAEGAAMVAEGLGGGVVPAAIDINMGCPVPKIAGNGEGSALMKSPDLVFRIVEAVKRAVSLPVTVKIRAGYDEQSKNAVEVALAAEAGGAAAITVHGRTKTQLYSGKADWNIIRNVKQALQIPVIANGDVLSAADALRIKAETNCDGIMVARGAVGNPFLFREIRDALEGNAPRPVTQNEKIGIAIRQLSLAIEQKGEYAAVRELRKQLLGYLKGLRGGASIRARIAVAESADEIVSALNEAFTEE